MKQNISMHLSNCQVYLIPDAQIILECYLSQGKNKKEIQVFVAFMVGENIGHVKLRRERIVTSGSQLML